jgi:hypothetical protein
VPERRFPARASYSAALDGIDNPIHRGSQVLPPIEWHGTVASISSVVAGELALLPAPNSSDTKMQRGSGAC